MALLWSLNKYFSNF